MLLLLLSSAVKFHIYCSSDLVNCVPLLLQRLCCIKLSTLAHPYQTPNAKVNQYFQFFNPFTDKLWNCFPLSAFPSANALSAFKKKCQEISWNEIEQLLWTFPSISKMQQHIGIFFPFLFASELHPQCKEKKKSSCAVEMNLAGWYRTLILAEGDAAREEIWSVQLRFCVKVRPEMFIVEDRNS